MTAVLENPYAVEVGREYLWLKGNLHTHSDRSDGRRPMQEVIDVYAKLKYDFLAMTDHDIYADYREIDARGMVLIHGNEVTSFGNHILQLGGTHRIEPDRDRQRVISEIIADGALAVLNHPNWQEDWNHCPFELMQMLQDYTGMEIFNGDCVDDVGSGLAIDKWERLLSAGRIIWGFANDDSHRQEHDGRGWNMVLVRKDQANSAGILAALRAGRFYASTGVRIDSIETQGAILHIAAAEAQQIEIYGERGMRLASVQGPELRYDADESPTTYVRAQLYGRGAEMAWTQPFLVRGGAGDRRRALDAQSSKPDAHRPALTARRVNSMPPFGSKEAEAAWKAAPVADLFYDAKSADKAGVRTVISALVSDSQLALRIVCDEPQMDKLEPRNTEPGNSSLWADESVQVFLDVEGTAQRYYQLTINPLGAWHITDSMGWSKTARFEARAMKGRESWTGELRLDLGSLAPGLEIRAGSRMGLHLSRNRRVAERRYVWCWTGSSNHVPARFGTLQL